MDTLPLLSKAFLSDTKMHYMDLKKVAIDVKQLTINLR
jgi:hypothetical protein